jgi:hypothetical protein
MQVEGDGYEYCVAIGVGYLVMFDVCVLRIEISKNLCHCGMEHRIMGEEFVR